MNSVCTIDVFDEARILEDQATGFWQESLKNQPNKPFDWFRMVKVTGLATFLAVSPFTAIPDPWLQEKRRRDAVVTVSIYQKKMGRFISRSEALQVARQILEQAEQERLTIAELEAARGIQWGDYHDL